MSIRIILTQIGSNVSPLLNVWTGTTSNPSDLYASNIPQSAFTGGYIVNAPGATYYKVTGSGGCGELILNCGGTPTTTTTTTMSGMTTTTTTTLSCIQISGQLGWWSTPEIACSSVPSSGGTYYGNNSSFALITTISANSGCTSAIPGYYSNGVIWKYTSNGTNIISSGVCNATTTTTTTQIVGLLNIENLSLVSNITNVTVNGTQVTLDNLTFPLTSGQTDTATTPYVGTYDVFVEMQSYDSTSSMVVESAPIGCFNVTSTGTVGHTFVNAEISSAITTSVNIQDIPC